jgi:hypothetical protein
MRTGARGGITFDQNANVVRGHSVGAGILTVHLRGPDSPNSLLFARSRATHTEPLDLVISDTLSAVELN